MQITFSKRKKSKNVLDFLVILPAEDLRRNVCGMSRERLIRRALKGLPGKLHVGNLDDMEKSCVCCADSYPIQGIIMPQELYILLPKEGIYVMESIWEHEYLKSQIQELSQIFRMLGATHVNYTATQTDAQNNGFKAGANATAFGYSVGTSAEVVRDNQNSTNLRSNIDYKDSHKTYSTIEEFMEDDTLFYFKTRPDWIKFAKETLEGRASKMNFEFSFNKAIKFSAAVTASFRAVGINCSSSSNSSHALTYAFEIEFGNTPNGSPVTSSQSAVQAPPPAALAPVSKEEITVVVNSHS